MTSGLSSGILSPTRRRPHEIWTPSKPSWAARGMASGLAARRRFQSVIPMGVLAAAARASGAANAAASKLRRVMSALLYLQWDKAGFIAMACPQPTKYKGRPVFSSTGGQSRVDFGAGGAVFSDWG